MIFKEIRKRPPLSAIWIIVFSISSILKDYRPFRLLSDLFCRCLVSVRILGTAQIGFFKRTVNCPYSKWQYLGRNTYPTSVVKPQTIATLVPAVKRVFMPVLKPDTGKFAAAVATAVYRVMFAPAA